MSLFLFSEKGDSWSRQSLSFILTDYGDGFEIDAMTRALEIEVDWTSRTPPNLPNRRDSR